MIAAAAAVPPSAMKTARVAMTFAYVSRLRMRSIAPPSKLSFTPSVNPLAPQRPQEQDGAAPKAVGFEALGGVDGKQLERLAQAGERERQLIDRGGEIVEDLPFVLECGSRHLPEARASGTEGVRAG